jgi:hypothetical protein
MAQKMALSQVARLLAPAGYTAAALALAALALFGVVVGSDTISQAANTDAFYTPTLAALGSTLALLVALVAMFIRQSGELGKFGVVAFLAALLGTALAIGAAWTYVFVLPYLAGNAPELADSSTGTVLVGFVVSYLLMGLGWLLFGVATLRTHVFARWAVVLLIAGAVITVIPMPSRTLVLALAVACLAFAAHRTSDNPALQHTGKKTDHESRNVRHQPAARSRS